MKVTSIKAAALACALATACAGASLAQPAPGADPAAPPPGGHRMMHERPDPAQMQARRAERLRAALQLTDRQEPALQDFVRAMAPPADGRQRMAERRQEMESLPTPQRLDRMRDAMAEHQQRFDQRAMATKRFYAQLTPSQQKAFDAMPHGHMGGRGEHGEHGGHRMGPPGPD